MSDETKFTPGPWVARESAHRIEWSHFIEANRVEVGATATGLSRETEDANAALIAAAPDMFAACRAWVAYFDRLARDDEPGDKLAEARNKFHGPRVEATRAAIARATGPTK